MSVLPRTCMLVQKHVVGVYRYVCYQFSIHRIPFILGGARWSVTDTIILKSREKSKKEITESEPLCCWWLTLMLLVANLANAK